MHTASKLQASSLDLSSSRPARDADGDIPESKAPCLQRDDAYFTPLNKKEKRTLDSDDSSKLLTLLAVPPSVPCLNPETRDLHRGPSVKLAQKGSWPVCNDEGDGHATGTTCVDLKRIIVLLEGHN